jgi:hypothetical protein
VFVYRDEATPPSRPADSAPRRPAADDAAYWYDLVAEDPSPGQEEARGPFEPLLSSSGGPSGGPGEGEERTPPPPDIPRQDSQEAPEQTRARKLEQLKDLYLTAEAIGEQNVDKHFDHLLAQQRELISEYFRQAGPADPSIPGPGPADGQATPPEGVSARAEPPRAW